MGLHYIQIVLYLSIGYFLFTISTCSINKHRINFHLLIVFIAVTALALQGAHGISFPYAILCLMIIGYSVWLFLKKVELQSLVINTPIAYLSFYFAIFLALLITGTADSLLFPEIFYIAVLFTSINAGRMASFGVAMLCIATIGLIYVDHASATGLFSAIPYRVIITSVLLVGIVQVAGYMYKKKVREAKEKNSLNWES